MRVAVCALVGDSFQTSQTFAAVGCDLSACIKLLVAAACLQDEEHTHCLRVPAHIRSSHAHIHALHYAFQANMS